MEASGKWKELGLQLGLDHSFLQTFYPYHSPSQQQVHFKEMLSQWLSNPPEYPNTRKILLQAIQAVDKGFAMKLKRDYDNEQERKCNIFDIKERVVNANGTDMS